MRQRVQWTGFVGAPGVTTFYWAEASTAQTPLDAFLLAMVDRLAGTVTLHKEPSGDVIDANSGELISSWEGAGHADFVGAGSGEYSAPIGWQTRWETASVVNGHRVRGRSYWVPSNNTMNGTNGTLNDAGRGALEGAAKALVTAIPGNLVIWTRPRKAVPTWTDKHGKVHPAVAAAAGSYSVVTDATVPDKAVVLTSRRD